MCFGKTEERFLHMHNAWLRIRRWTGKTEELFKALEHVGLLARPRNVCVASMMVLAGAVCGTEWHDGSTCGKQECHTVSDSS